MAERPPRPPEDEKVQLPQDLWPAAEPPAGFADRVMSARRREVRPATRRFWTIAAAAAVLVAVGAWVLRPVSGTLAPDARASATLGRRGVAVAEAGAKIRWSVGAGGRALVQQDEGDVFYRVEPGAAFTVATPNAEILVTGTCFRVEVVPMGPLGKMAMSAAAGAAAASAVVVTVYEGRVRVSTADGAAEVPAGESVRAEGGGPPRKIVRVTPTPAALLAPPPSDDPSNATHDQLLEREKQERAQIAALQSRVRELESERNSLARRAPTTRRGDGEESGPDGLPPREKFHGFTPSELQAMARNCEVRVDSPPLDREPWKMHPEMGARLHLSDEEQARVTEAMNKVRADAIARLRALYIEATGDVAAADSLEPSSLGREILHKSRRPDVEAARAKVARERAGIDPMPPDPNQGTIPERYFRAMIAIGDSLQQQIEPAVGAQQAGTVRDQLAAMKMTMNGCDDSARR